MNLSELIQKRQSDRKYESRPVSREMVMKCLEAARLAPSACNSQPWKFVVVDDVALLPQMGAAAAGMGMNGFAREVPVIVAVVLEKMNLTARIGSVIKDISLGYPAGETRKKARKSLEEMSSWNQY